MLDLGMTLEYREERIKEGRKTVIQHCIYDTFESRVVARFADKKKALEILDKAKGVEHG